MRKNLLKIFTSDQQGIPRLKGAHNDGMKYESQVMTHLAIQLAHDPLIDDYWIITSPKFVDGFDDIVAVIKDNIGNKHVLMLQLKYSKKIMRLVTEKKKDSPPYLDIPLHKYLKTFNDLNNRSSCNNELQKELIDIPFENHYFGIFTTMTRDIEVEVKKDEYKKIQLIPINVSEISILKYVATNKQYSLLPNMFLKDYECLLSKLHFFVEQHDSENINKVLQASSPMFTRSMMDNLCNIIERYMNGSSDNVCLPLTKAIFFEMHLEVRLSQTLCVHTNKGGSFRRMETNVFKMWRSIFETYNIVIFDKTNIKQCRDGVYAFYEQQIRHVYNESNFIWHDCAENCFRLNEATIRQLSKCDVTVTHLNDLLMYMWKHNKIPLVIDDKTKDCFKSVINTLSKFGRQYILGVNETEKIDIPNDIEVFKSGYDLRHHTHFHDIMDLDVLLQGRVKVPLKYMVGDSVDIAKSISASDILKWTYHSNQPILIGKKIKEVDKCYIKRKFSISGEIMDEESIMKNLKPGLTVISNGPGMGKSTVIGSLALNCKSTDYVLTYNLADCVNDLELDYSKIHSNPIDFFFEKMEHVPTKLLKEIYKQFKISKKLVLLIDSFDEILPIFTEKVLHLLKKMIQVPVFITTRTQAAPVLKNHFKTINIIKLKEFDQKDVNEYLQNQGISEDICEGMPPDALTTPLHLVMYCSVYKKNGTNGSGNAKSSKIYEEFIREKIRIYFSKIKINDQNNQFRMEPEKIRNVHIKVALVYIFGKDIVEEGQLLNKQKWNKIIKQFNEYKMALGILSHIDTHNGFDQIRFVHKTFAEYFVALWLFEGCSEKVPLETFQNIFDNVMGNSNYTQINKFLCEFKTSFMPLEMFKIDNIEPKIITFLLTTDNYNLLPLQWVTMNMYYASAESKSKSFELFEKILFYSAIVIDEKDFSILGRCFDSNMFYKNAITTSQQFDRCYVVQFIELLRKFNSKVEYSKYCKIREIEYHKWFSSYVDILSKFTVNQDIMPMHGNLSRLYTALLHVAYLVENIKVVKFILNSHEVDLNAQNNCGDYILHIACSHGNRHIVEVLLDRKVDPNMVNWKKQTSLHVACMKGHIDIVKLLLQKHADLYQMDEESKTCLELCSDNILNPLLHYACTIGECDLVLSLLLHGADPNATNDEGLNSLHLAWRQGNVEIVRILLHYNINPFLKDRNGKCCLDVSPMKENKSALSLLLYDACIALNGPLVQFLLENKADPNVRGEEGHTPLHAACHLVNNGPLVQILLEHKADPNVLDEDGNSPLHVACQLGCIDIINVLLNNKANPKLLNKAEENCLHATCRRNNVDVVKRILMCNIDPNQLTGDGSTCLHLACHYENIEVVEILLAHNANPNLLNNLNENSLHIACRRNVEIVKRILIYKVDVNQPRGDGSRCLHLACQYGDKEIVEILLNHNADPNLLDSYYQNSLHIACRTGNIETVKRLLKYNLNVNQQTRDGFSCLHLACLSGDEEVVEILLSHNADPNLLSIYKESSLHVACFGKYDINNVETVKRLLKCKINVNQKTGYGYTCLHLACQYGHKEIVEALLNHNAERKINVNQRTDDGLTCLHLACKRGDVTIVEMLLDKNAEPNLLSKDQENCLHLACRKGNVDIVKQILQRNVDVNVRARNDLTCLHLACQNENVEIVKLLLNHFADPNLLNFDKENSLHIACRGNNVDVVRAILDYKVDVNQKTRNGSACLHLACENGSAEIVEILLNHNADPNVLNLDKEDSLYIACRVGNADIVKNILKYRVNVNHQTLRGFSCLHVACQNGNEEIVRMLINHKADPNLMNILKQNSLHIACRGGFASIVSLMIDLIANINQSMWDGSTCLHLACYNRNATIVQSLLRYGADPNILEEEVVKQILKEILNTSIDQCMQREETCRM